ncbi:MAG TPA: cob(I)yrinic acid a,c-diamide adenosyltransferase [Candidatus Avacidaminococcus intestinavium]|uniref:Cob(I)yrinic acid a,c-diamide adenosyltransferase n=1 Tax=Candidatus Avacidaminococcus intestinavium TaxID=2840684 RepID=A0A9D1MQX8_9FIRM|nr:cob(I)yrinic acid a,c-diamide adenosyltransferase [Candidatus Avacidaminococcus intestinavium]
MEQGLIHIYCGDGKGKTTACLGLAIRCAGRNNKVLFAQFLKGRPSGELSSLALLPNIEVLRGKEILKFTFQMNDVEKQQVAEEHQKLFAQIIAKCQTEKIDLLVLDEVVGACDKGLFDEKLLIDFLRNKDKGLEVALSGRNPSQNLIDLADYVSEIKKIKHPYEKGISARDGIER